MTLGQMRAQVRQYIREPVEIIVQNAEINEWLNTAQGRIVAETLCLEGRASLSTIANQERYPMPCDYLKVYQVAVDDCVIGPTEQRDHGAGMAPAARSTLGTAEPTGYYLLGQYIGFRPVPNAVYTINIIYRKTATAMALDTTAPEIEARWHHVPVHYGVWQGFLKLGDIRMAREFERLWINDLEAMKRETSLRHLDVGARITDGYHKGYADASAEETWLSRLLAGLS